MAKAAAKSPKPAGKPAIKPKTAKKPGKTATKPKVPAAERAGSWIRETCTKADLSRLMGVSMRALSDWDAKGLLVRGAKNGTYMTIPSLQARFKLLAEMAAGRAAETKTPLAEERLLAAQTDRQIQQLKLAQLQGSVLTQDEVSESWSEMSTKFKAAALSIPGKARSAIPHLTAHDAEELKILVKDMLNDLADEVEASVIGGVSDDFKV